MPPARSTSATAAFNARATSSAAAGAAATRVLAAAPEVVASTATTDARTFQLYADTPAVCFGPRAEAIHSVDERVHLPSIVQTAQVVALFIRDWCGVTRA